MCSKLRIYRNKKDVLVSEKFSVLLGCVKNGPVLLLINFKQFGALVNAKGK
jgi:hypothetical protein